MSHYVFESETGYRIVGSRVPLSAIVLQFRLGHSPETIQESFPTLRLEEVYGAITFYLANRQDVDDAVLNEKRISEEAWGNWASKNMHLIRRLSGEIGEDSILG